MPRLMITCPTTGRPAPTGLNVTRTTFSRTRIEREHCACRWCGRTHAWTKADAFFEGDPPPPQRGAPREHPLRLSA